MTILLQRLFLVVFLFGTLFANVYGQNDGGEGSSNDSGGIFKDKSKVEGDGGTCPGCPPCAWYDEVPDFYVEVDLEDNSYPCDLYIGITFGNGQTQYQNIATHGTEMRFFPPDYEGCIDGQISVEYTMDLYCLSGNGVMSSIAPCESDDFDDLLPDELEDECSLSTVMNFTVCCYGGTSSEPGLPTPETPDVTRTLGRSVDCKETREISIFSLDGRRVYRNRLIDSIEKIEVIQELYIKSGLYIMVTEKCGVVTTQKVFKN